MAKSLAFAVLLCSCIVSAVFGIKWEDCGSSATVSSVDISGCENVDVCPLKKGTNVQLKIGFESKGASNTLNTVVHGVIHGVPLPFHLPQPDACEKCGVTCPIQNGQNYIYNNFFEVKRSYPAISVTVKWELQDDAGNDVVCLKIPSAIES